MARRAAYRPRAAFKRANPRGQRRYGRVGQPRVNIADFLQIEQFGGVIGVAENIGRGLINRNLPRAGGRIGRSACVNGQRVKALWFVVHVILPRLLSD